MNKKSHIHSTYTEDIVLISNFGCIIETKPKTKTKTSQATLPSRINKGKSYYVICDDK